MNRLRPIFASEKTMAELLDMRVDQFRELARRYGLTCHLLGELRRYDVDRVAAALRGEA